jgi:hypothetical protein
MQSNGRASAAESSLQAIFGTVVQVTLPDTLAVATDAGVQTLVVSGEDVFTGDITSLDDVAEGDRVIASAFVGDDGVFTAQRVLIKADSSSSATKHILGVVLETSDGAFSIQDIDGNTLKILVPEGVSVPGTGSVVTAVVQVDRATGNLTARAFDLAEDAVKRLQQAADAATDEDVKKDLEARLENARDQHLTALEKARIALERAKQAVDQSDQDELGRAVVRLNEVQSKFQDVRVRYEQEATAREERLPELRITGSIRYGEAAWEQQSGVFNLAIQLGDAVDDSAVRAFTWDSSTLAIVPIEVKPEDGDGVTPLQGTSVAPSEAIPLNSVKSLIPNGSRVIVQYDPNAEPPKATLVTMLPPELPAAIEAALRQEQLLNFTGFITLVEATPDLDAALGVVVVANNANEQKIAAKVTADTKIEVDGKTSTLSDLAAGMAVEVEFNVIEVTADASAAFSVDGRLDAKRIRARTVVDDRESHIAGVISKLDPETRSVTIKPIGGSEVTILATDDALIVKDGQPARFGALSVGDLVLDATRYNRETSVVTRLVAQSPRLFTFSGSITGMDRNPNRVTVTTAEGNVMSVFITDSTAITSETEGEKKFSDLAVGDRVLKGSALPVELGGRTVNVASELVIGQARVITARGVVRSADVEAGELIIVTSSASAANAVEITLLMPEGQRPVMYKNGEQIKSLASVMAGDIVESVTYDAATSVIQKLSVVSPNIQRVRGVVDAVVNDRLTMVTADGRTIELTVVAETQVTLNGRVVNSLSRVQPGDNVAQAVYIALTQDLTRGVAVQLTLQSASSSGSSVSGTPVAPNDSSVIETTVAGVLTDVEGSIWAIGGRRFRVTDQTQFFGAEPQAGLVAKATLQTRDGGELVALAISVAGRPDTNPSDRPAEISPADPSDTPADGTSDGLVRVTGRVQAVERQDDSTLIIVIDAVKIATTADTRISGEPAEGVAALAVVRRMANGDMVALSIVFGSSDGRLTDGSAGSGGTTTVTPTPSPTVTATPAATDEVKQVRIVVEAVSGRIALAEGKLYLLTVTQAIGVKIGDTLTLSVRETAFSDLTLVQRTLVSESPLYQANASDADPTIFVAA